MIHTGMIRRLAFTGLLALSLAGCGGRQDLKPKEGHATPPIPRGATEALTAQQLLAPSSQARPERNAELLRQSQERKDDSFDLPPDSN
jgi:hypothetical protein